MDEFGFDAIFDDGVKEQEAAEPAEEVEGAEENEPAETEGVKEQEIAEPAEVQSEEQSAEENAAFASIRRKAEKEADMKIQKAVEKATSDAEARMLSMISGLGLSNPYTGKGLQTMDDLHAYADAMREEQKKLSLDKMEQAGYSEEEIKSVIENLVANHPDVRKASELLPKIEQMEREAEDARVKKHIDSEIQAIREFDPEVRTFEEIVESDRGSAIIGMIKRGYSLSDAYYLAHKDTINKRTAELSRQEAMNAARGKDHLNKSVSHGDGGVVVSSDVIADFRRLNPDMSVDEIRAWVARDAKRMKH